MSKLHGDFGDLSRYEVHAYNDDRLGLVCQDCDRIVVDWDYSLGAVPLDELTRAAGEHETSEERDDDVPDDAVPVDKLDELARHYNER